ncbi:MAG: hypothetical protein AUJ75_04165 [Candidatus Omnitrophica bacterium CG1_02_49_10]|nr:MAG: hypothetical protein AUJ75_04165 [Candidatus Omnitrophica bacterium CG1_02_49_10]
MASRQPYNALRNPAKIKRFISIVFLWSLLLYQSYDASAFTVTDSTGTIFEFNTPPKRIVSLVPAVTENLYLLGAEDAVVGVTSFCLYPARAQEKEKAGTFLNPNVEKVLRLSPDIVFATKEGQRKELIFKMRSVGLNVFVLSPNSDFADISEDFLLLGRIVGKEKKAEEILKGSDKKIRDIRTRLEGEQSPLVFLQLDTRPLVSVGGGTFTDELIYLAGGVNIAHSSPIRYPRYSVEEVVIRDPDVIVIIAMGADVERERAAWQRYRSLSAVKQGRVYIIDAHKVSTSVPTVFTQGLEALAALLHPDENSSGLPK